MDKLGNDELATILKWVQDPHDRKSLSLVCKRWCKIEGFNKVSLRIFEPNSLHKFLPRFPNLLKFESSETISDTQMIFLAKTCPKIQRLNLKFDTFDASNDFGDHGLFALSKGCSNLRSVILRKRRGIRDGGVASLAKFLKNLVNLDLGFCKMITDEALETIGKMGSLRSLNLQGCCLISDLGLSFLANGILGKSLVYLVLAECDRISDVGVMELMNLRCLEELNVAECGPKVTDIGGKAIAAMESLKRLNLSWLINVSDDTVFALAEISKNLVSLDLTGCEMITGDGIRAFASHKCLCEIVLTSVNKFNANDLEELVFGCKSLEFVRVDARLRSWIPVTEQGNIFRPNCWISWRL
ncbi:hypothetical protein ACH5RR_041219 [Cinchona calisaya]|uniref:Uncharacterized protein n=1 Tax=Cinchona calisaya TaxID=153742 RepID=A0ABD2XW11_9GENT